jgi:hypothetical protein
MAARYWGRAVDTASLGPQPGPCVSSAAAYRPLIRAHKPLLTEGTARGAVAGCWIHVSSHSTRESGRPMPATDAPLTSNSVSASRSESTRSAYECLSVTCDSRRGLGGRQLDLKLDLFSQLQHVLPARHAQRRATRASPWQTDRRTETRAAIRLLVSYSVTFARSSATTIGRAGCAMRRTAAWVRRGRRPRWR